MLPLSCIKEAGETHVIRVENEDATGGMRELAVTARGREGLLPEEARGRKEFGRGSRGRPGIWSHLGAAGQSGVTVEELVTTPGEVPVRRWPRRARRTVDRTGD